MDKQPTQIEMPWHIYAGESDDLVFHSGYWTEGAARVFAASVNEKAEKLGIKTRYKVTPQSDFD
jgi:hypothetical protein